MVMASQREIVILEIQELAQSCLRTWPECGVTEWYSWSQELLKTQSHRDTGSCKDFDKHHPPTSQLFCMEVDDSDHRTHREGKKMTPCS